MKNRIITISREFGSGGRTIGRNVAEKLGIPCYDYELIEKAAEKSGFAKEYIEEVGEHVAKGGWLANAFSAERGIYGNLSNRDYVWVVQRKIIKEIAEEGSCVIIGRCADYILKDKADCLKVFIYSDMEKRADRIVKLYGERDESPEKRLKDKDKRRKEYYNFYTDMEWGNVHQYNIALDSGTLGIEKCVEIIADLYPQKN